MAEPREENKQEPTSPKLEVMQADNYSQFLLYSKTEIVYILRSLLEQGSLITIYFNQGNDFLLTSLLDVSQEDGQIVLDYGSNMEMNQRALKCDKLFCISSHEKVKIQFVLHGVDNIVYAGRDAFLADLPDTLLRLQRREYYRLVTPMARPLICQIPIIGKNGAKTLVKTTVMDISGGGISLVAPPPDVRFEPDMDFPGCTVELPEIGVITTTLRVCSVYDVTLRNGTKIRRSGCQFFNLSGPMLTMIQRYIIKVERERKARESGMA